MQNEHNDCDDDAPMEITFNFKWPQHRYELTQFISMDEMTAILRDIDNSCRAILKWGNETHTLESFCEEIRGKICEILSRVDE